MCLAVILNLIQDPLHNDGCTRKYIYKGGMMNFEWKRFVVAFLAMMGFFFIAVVMC